MQFKWLNVILLAAVALAGCASQSEHTYAQPPLTFTYPAAWRLASQVWSTYQPGREFKDLGVVEIVKVTSVRKTGQEGAYFVAASAPLAEGQTLEAFYRDTYAPIRDTFRNVQERTFDLGERAAFEMQYERPWGEPWWHFRDVWVEADGTVYLFSAYALPGKFDSCAEDFAAILDSVALEP